MKRAENQTIEYKESWHDKYLEWICGYANAKGGTLYIGIEDGTKKPVGVKNPNKLMEDIPNTIRNTMGIVADVSLAKKQGKDVIRIKVKPSGFPVSCRGGYFYRTGSVKMQLVGNALTDFILRKAGTSWDACPTASGKRIQDCRFTILSSNCLDQTGRHLQDTDFRSFGLAGDDGVLTNAGALFADDSPIFQNRLFCTRWNGLDKAAGIMDALDGKEFSGSVLSLFEYGKAFVKTNSRTMWHKAPSHRLEFPEYPERAVEESIANALVHRDYTVFGSEVHIDIFDDRIEIVSPGGMFDGGLPIQDRPNLRAVGSSRRNPIVAFATPNSRTPNSRTPNSHTPNSRPVGRGLVRLLRALRTERGSAELVSLLGIKNRTDLYTRFLLPSLQQGLIEYTIPGKPNSRLQKYRLTAKGRDAIV